MRKIYKLANKYFLVLGEEDLIPETMRAPYSYQDRDREDEGIPSGTVPNVSLIKLELTPDEITDLHFLTSAILSEHSVLQKLVKFHGKKIIDTLRKFNHYASQLRATLNQSEETVVASVAQRMLRTLAAIEYEDWDGEKGPETVRNPGAYPEFPTSSAPTQRRPNIWLEEAEDEYPEVQSFQDAPETEMDQRAYRHPESQTLSIDTLSRNEIEMITLALQQLERTWSSRSGEESEEAVSQAKTLIQKLEMALED